MVCPNGRPAESKTSLNEAVATNQFPAAPKPSPANRFDLPRAFRQAVPSSVDDLKAIQGQVEALAVRLAPAVVEVEVGMGSGSGVVISEDGLVLTAAHVCGTPNLDVVFTFPNGKKVRGKTLGTNHDMDAGLMKITDPGHWPRVETGELDDARLGDWVLALGHPGGFDPERPMVVRLGRLLKLGPGLLQTDCTLIGGDSGGPLFDMHGRVIGIHSRISNRREMVMPADLKLTYDDGSSEVVRLPVEIWNLGSRFAYTVTATGKRVVRAEVDPEHRLPDVERGNNTWPRSR